jgi:hypothetical protein
MDAAWIALLVGWALGIATVGVLIGAGVGWAMIRELLGAEPGAEGNASDGRRGRR